MAANAPVQRRAAQRTVRCNRLLCPVLDIELIAYTGLKSVLGDSFASRAATISSSSTRASA